MAGGRCPFRCADGIRDTPARLRFAALTSWQCVGGIPSATFQPGVRLDGTASLPSPVGGRSHVLVTRLLTQLPRHDREFRRNRGAIPPLGWSDVQSADPRMPTANPQRTAPRVPQRSPKREYPPAPEPLPVPVMDNHTHLDFPDGHGAGGSQRGSHGRRCGRGCPGGRPGGLRPGIVAVHRAGGGAGPTGCWALWRCTPTMPRTTPPAANSKTRSPRSSSWQPTRGSVPSARQAWTSSAPKARGWPHQRYSFRRHIDIAKRLDLTLQIHDRDAHADVVQVLAEEGAPERVVFHCFSGDEELARICNREGWYMSFAGTLTFRNAANLRCRARGRRSRNWSWWKRMRRS